MIHKIWFSGSHSRNQDPGSEREGPPRWPATVEHLRRDGRLHLTLHRSMGFGLASARFSPENKSEWDSEGGGFAAWNWSRLHVCQLVGLWFGLCSIKGEKLVYICAHMFTHMSEYASPPPLSFEWSQHLLIRWSQGNAAETPMAPGGF